MTDDDIGALLEILLLDLWVLHCDVVLLYEFLVLFLLVIRALLIEVLGLHCELDILYIFVSY